MFILASEVLVMLNKKVAFVRDLNTMLFAGI